MADRRSFLKAVGAIGGATLLGSPASATDAVEPDPNSPSVLVDITRCIGCRRCEAACGEENGRYVPDIQETSVFEQKRNMTPSQWTVVNRYQTDHGGLYVKRQCMHCDQPGCAAACLTRAMYKTPEGPIIWRGRKCMGCRFCMISCPFDVPKFEYHSANPRIEKCILCPQRLARGKLPACVESCPVEALLYGKRGRLLEVAKQRIYGTPGKYVPAIYGEHEVAGTAWLYLSPVPFDQVGFRTDLGTASIPGLSKDFLYAVPIVLLLWPTFLYGVSRARAAERGAGQDDRVAGPRDSK